MELGRPTSLAEPEAGDMPSAAFGPAAAAQTAWVKLAALLAAGFLTNFTVSLVGALPVGEFVLAGALGWLAVQAAFAHVIAAAIFRSKLLWIFIGCQAVAFGGYMLSDIYWASSGNDIARGWARMVFLGIDVLAIAYLFDLPGLPPLLGFATFEAGYALGGAASTLMGNVLFDDYWKFGWAGPVTIAVMIFAPRLGFWTAQAACLALVAVHVAYDFRSLAAVCIGVAILMVFLRLVVRQRVAALAVCAVLGIAALFGLKHWSETRGDNVRSARSDVERAAMVQAAWEGFLRSPWLGNGSWFSRSNVMQEFFAIRYQNSIENGVGSYEEDGDDNAIAIHSQLLVGLAEGGILGGCFFLFYGAMLLWALGWIVLTQYWTPWSPLCVFYLLLKVSDLLTSPFSGAHRVLIAVGVGLILLLWHRAPAEEELPLGTAAEPA